MTFTRLDRSFLALGYIGMVLFFVSPQQAHAQDSGLSARVRGCMEDFVAQKQIAGAVTAVGRADKVLSIEAVGLARIDTDAPMKIDSLFRIASMTKPLTAIGIMLLSDEGKLTVDDLVEKHLPEFRGQMMVASKSGDTITLKKATRPITLRDLLTHTSGLPGSPPPGLSDLYLKRNHSLAEGVMAFSQRPLEFEPGSKWSYCNTGIDTLGRIIEVVSGRPYETFLKERLFDPLGMKDSAFYPNDDQLERTATTYDRKDGALKPVAAPVVGPPKGARYPIPAGGLYSTAADLSKVYQMMLNGGVAEGRRLLSESAIAAMTKVQTGDLKAGFTDGMGFGFGWGVLREPSGVTAMLSPGTYGHGGAFGTQAWIDPKKGVFVVMLIQRTGLANGDASEMRKQFQQVVFNSLK